MKRLIFLFLVIILISGCTKVSEEPNLPSDIGTPEDIETEPNLPTDIGTPDIGEPNLPSSIGTPPSNL